MATTAWLVRESLATMPGVALRPDEFARRLRELRGPASKEAAARKIGVGIRHYHRWEEGKTIPRMGSIEKVVEAYDLNFEEFVAEIAPRNGREGMVERLERIESKLDKLLRNHSA